MTLRPSVVAFAAAIAGVAAFGYLGSEFKRNCVNSQLHMAGVAVAYWHDPSTALDYAGNAVSCLAR